MFRSSNSIQDSERSWWVGRFLLSALVLGTFVLAAILLSGRAIAQTPPVGVDLAADESVVEAIGESSGSLTGSAVSGDCDVNGDGLDDAIVGAFTADPTVNTVQRSNAGSAYVVFGQEDGGDEIQLGTLGTGGFRIDGAAANDNLGFSVKCAGDVNGDDRDDIIVGAGGADNNLRSNSGSAYVVFGKTDPGTIDFATFGTQGNDDEPVPTNEPPEAKKNSYKIKQGRTLKVDAKKGVLKNDSDPDGDRLRVTRVTDEPDRGRLKIDPDGSFVYKPENDFRGKDSFEYEVSDSEGGTDRAEVTIKVKPDRGR